MSALPWQVETLRKTFLFPMDNALTTTSLWQQVVGTEPSERNEKLVTRTISELGDWLDHKLSITTQPGRIDVVFHAAMTTPELPNAGQYVDVIKSFSEIRLPPLDVYITRVALGATLLLPGKSHEDCYKTLGTLLPHVQVNPASREFQYRINNPKESKVVPNSLLNCISAWAALRAQFMTIPSSSSIEAYATRVELDISTDADLPLPNDCDRAAIFEELIATASLILDEGAKP